MAAPHASRRPGPVRFCKLLVVRLPACGGVHDQWRAAAWWTIRSGRSKRAQPSSIQPRGLNLYVHVDVGNE
eukprot:357105-Chlamydomonas_euryale.AAC.4